MMIVSAPSLEELQQENCRLLALIEHRENTIEQQKTFIDALKHQLDLFRHARFGRKSEKGAVPEQLCIQFDEAVPVVEPEVQEEADTETVTYTRKKKKPGRKPLPKSLPYLEKIHDLSEKEKQCPCGCTMSHISDEVTEQLDVVPQMTFRTVHIRKKYACKSCEETIRLAALPKQPIDKAIATPGLLAAVINSKFNCHMPLYRQEAMFQAAGISLTRGTLSNWLIKSADLLKPLVKLMIADIHDYDIAWADETPLQVLKEKGQKVSKKSTMWLFMGGPPEKRAVVYQYHPSRSHQIPFEFFSDFKGYLHADCYKAYVTMGKLEHIHHIACWAHARRYFVDVAKTAKKEGLTHRIVAIIGKLYQIERELKEKNATPTQVFMTRIRLARPILCQLKALFDESLPKVPPQSPIAQALTYALTHWASLNHYLYDGRLEIDNNRAERAIKPFVIGRKNWLFHGNDIGANAGSILFSLIETCKQHQIDVFSWFKYVLANVHQAKTMEELEKLLPYNIDKSLLNDMRSIPVLIFPTKEAVE